MSVLNKRVDLPDDERPGGIGITTAFLEDFEVNVDHLARLVPQDELLEMMGGDFARGLIDPTSPHAAAAALLLRLKTAKVKRALGVVD